AQRAAERARQVAGLPARAGREITEKVATAATDLAATAAAQARAAAAEVAGTVTTAVTTASEAVDRARTEVTEAATRAARITDAAWTAGRDAALRDGDHEARATGADTTAEVLHEARAELGVLDEAELPIRGYDALTVPEVVARLDRVTDPRDLKVVDAYERAHKNRKSVLEALRQASSELVGA
ncbi:hypothetical protein ACXR2U_20690, partial [Jatrophihabitans sp. YIM 134969]